MPTEVNGLPAHVLLVHVVVALVPLTGLLLLLSVFWPAARARIGVALPVLALVTLVSVPVTTHAGEWLEHRVDPDPLVERHAELGDQMLPWAIGLFVVSVLVWAAHRWSLAGSGTSAHADPAARGATALRREGGFALPLAAALAVLAVVATIGSVVTVYRIGDSGAKASWHDSFSKTPHGED
ncbi:hypothetical protein CLV35_0470 [Motilibacter peucedani]|uniref:Uncharacterized protein n=1 Tax=Motilibacter peucedani TaxID=598650 RepID=A0A420XTI7_9ACTN|nr:DUF2231 domain-containing protein [Motilibacter peucedani]RKS80051.1 hypothetical protein CLV35_0470 [Motilibacter peucedani]